MKRPILICVAVLASLYMVGLYMENELYAQHSAGGGASVHGASARPISSTKGSTGGQKTPSELLQDNKNLSNKLSTILAKQGITNIQQAAQGFKNLGQFVAAVHVSQNLGIPFTSLKTDMMNGDSLGKAIHALKPDVASQVESKKGLKQANEDIKESESKT
jgi:hypothetical protein